MTDEALRRDNNPGTDEPSPPEVIQHSVPSLEREFKIAVPDPGAPWHGVRGDGRIGITVYPDPKSDIPSSKHLADGRPWLLWNAVAIKNACTPMAHKVQWGVAELNGVFVHVHDEGGLISIVVAAERLKP